MKASAIVPCLFDKVEVSKMNRRYQPAGLIVLLILAACEARDDSEDLASFLQPEEQGDARAQFNLGLKYSKGQGVPQNYSEAMNWWRQAAEQGHADAQHFLGVMYHGGQGVPEDYVQAYAWYSLAAATGLRKSIEARQRVQAYMTPEQIAASQELSTELHEKIQARLDDNSEHP